MSGFKKMREKMGKIWLENIYKKFSKIAEGRGKRSLSCLGIFFGVSFWLFEAYLHTKYFGGKPFIREIFFPLKHELWMRSATTILFYILGFSGQYLLNKSRNAEKELRLTNEKLNKIFQTAADGMRLVDINHKVLDVNDTFVKLSGIEKEESIGKECKEFWGETCETNECPMFKIKGGMEHYEDEVVKVHKDGTKIPCIVTATPYRGENGELVGIVEDFKDMRWYLEKKKGKEQEKNHNNI